MPVSADKQAHWPYGTGLVLCVIGGVSMGVFFSVIALAIWLFRGAEPFSMNEVTLGRAVAVYLLGFSGAGLIVGLLNPLGRSRTGAFALGVVSSIPLATAASFFVTGTRLPWDGDNPFIIGAMALGLGGPMGLLAWREFVGRATGADEGDES